MSAETISVRIGNQNISVPVFIDQETTLQIADMLNERLQVIENQSTRIDSHRFALLAAMHFACEWEGLKRQTSQETKELVKALSRISDSLQQIIESL